MSSVLCAEAVKPQYVSGQMVGGCPGNEAAVGIIDKHIDEDE